MKLFLNDTDILLSLKKSDPDAFEYVYGLYFKSLCYFAEKITGSSVHAEDIATESFVKLLQKSPDFETLANLKSFLYISTRNGCYDQLRMKKRHETSHLEIRHLAPLSEDEIENNIILTEVLQAIYSAIEKLPLKYKNVVRLALVGGKDNDEIATETRMANQTVRNRKSEGIKLLRLALFKNDEISRSALFLCLLHISKHL
jgi:RNA polymerase sigma factor (sigma-70 family)